MVHVIRITIKLVHILFMGGEGPQKQQTRLDSRTNLLELKVCKSKSTNTNLEFIDKASN